MKKTFSFLQKTCNYNILNVNWASYRYILNFIYYLKNLILNEYQL